MSNKTNPPVDLMESRTAAEQSAIGEMEDFRDFLGVLEVCDMTDEEIAEELRSRGIEPYRPKDQSSENQMKENDSVSSSPEDAGQQIQTHTVDKSCSSTPKDRVRLHEQGYLTYVQEQLYNEDTAKKKSAVAKYALEELRNHSIIRNGDTIFIDAGSSPMKVWESLKSLDDYNYKSIYTSNYLIIKDWMDNSYGIPESEKSKVIMVGNKLDRDHGAFYGDALCEIMVSPSFRPAVMFIGCAGIEFDKTHGIFYGYHGDDLEASAKTSYFKCRARLKIILATAEKIGSAGGQVFNLLDISGFDYESPVCLITTEPEEGRETRNFEKAKSVFKSNQFMQLVRGSKINFHWIVIDNEQGNFKYEVKLGGATDNVAHLWQEIWG